MPAYTLPPVNRRRLRPVRVVVVAVVLALMASALTLAVPVASGAVPDADITWNGGSPSLLKPPGVIHPEAQAIASDGSVFVVGSDVSSNLAGTAVTKLRSNGSVDSIYGTSGTARVATDSNLGIWILGPVDAALQPTSGGLIIVGQRGGELGLEVVRLTASGAMDPTFGVNGRVAIRSVAGYYLSTRPRVRILPTGEIIVGLFAVDSALSYYLPAAIRLSPSGVVDSSFGTNGLALATLSTQPERTLGHIGNIAVDHLGRVVLGGASPSNESLLVRWTAEGVLDPSFAQQGVMLSGTPLSQCGRDIAVDALNRIIASCLDAPFGFNPIAHLRRYQPDGEVDPSFGQSGDAWISPGPVGYTNAATIAMQGNRIVVAGEVSEQYFYDQSVRSDVAVWRFTDGGQLDRSFGIAGKLIRDDFAPIDRDPLLSVLPDGRLSVVLFDPAAFVGPQIAVFRHAAGSVQPEASLNTIPNPQRLLDTRSGIGAPIGKVETDATLPFTVTGRAGVPANAVAVALNVTVTGPEGPGFVTVFRAANPYRPHQTSISRLGKPFRTRRSPASERTDRSASTPPPEGI